MAQSKLFVLPTKWEGFGLSVREASAIGIRSIVSNVGALSELNNGIVEHATTKEGFVNAITEALKNDSYGKINISIPDTSKRYYRQIDNVIKEIIRSERENA